jgi:hypothetical protein
MSRSRCARKQPEGLLPNLRPSAQDGHSKLVALIAGLIALLGLAAIATAGAGHYDDGGSHLECAQDDSVRECVYDEPQTSIASGPIGFTNDNTPTFGLHSDQDDVQFTCKVDGERTPKCGPSYTAETPLANGAHSISVLARSNGHTPDTTPAERNFVVDTIKPNTVIGGGPVGLTSDNTPTFTFNSSEPTGATFQCKVDGGAFAPCTSPRATPPLGDGVHTFYVRAIDRAHNMDDTPASRQFTVDATPPITTITGGPSGLTSDTTPTFTFKSNESGSTFQCKVDGGSFGACGSPRTTPALGDGSHTFSVRAIDHAGNVDASPASRSFVVDARPPNTTITSGPSGSITDTTPTFAFKSSESGGSFQCKVDGGAYSGCTSPKTTAPLALGAHSFSVRATDQAGHTDPTPAVRTFTVKRSR